MPANMSIGQTLYHKIINKTKVQYKIVWHLFIFEKEKQPHKHSMRFDSIRLVSINEWQLSSSLFAFSFQCILFLPCKRRDEGDFNLKSLNTKLPC